jgi:hypothetical protein
MEYYREAGNNPNVLQPQARQGAEKAAFRESQ